MHRTLTLVLWLTAAGSTACGDGGDSESTGDEGPWPAGCDSIESTGDDRGTCRIWSGDKTAEDDAFRGQCEQEYDGAYGDRGCPNDGLVGMCETDQGYGLLLDYHYYSPVYTPETARTACETLPSCSFSCVFVGIR